MGSKSTYHIKETKNTYKFSYSGDLREALDKAKGDLHREMNNKDIPYWVWLKEKAEKAIKANSNKIRRIQAFIDCAERQLQKEEKEDT